MMMMSAGLKATDSELQKNVETACGLSLQKLKDAIDAPNSNIQWVKTVDVKDFNRKEAIELVVHQGLPLMVRGVTKDWNRDMFSWDWLSEHMGESEMINSPRNNDTCEDLSGWTVKQYVDYLHKPTEERNPPRLYGKDMTCPEPWTEYIFSHLDPYYRYRGPYDLVANMPEELQPLSLMIYVGSENNFTPGHKDICGSLGHNIMVHADEGACSIWFMMSTADRHKVAKHWREKGSNVDHDNHFMPLEDLIGAPFTVYAVEQREGDFVLVPPLSVHQVINKGGRSVKVAWNTITAQSIGYSYITLPELHKISKPEIYRIKATTYYSILKMIKDYKEGNISPNFTECLKYLLDILRDYAAQEYLDVANLSEKYKCLLAPEKFGKKEGVDIQMLDDSPKHTRTCNFCKADIFNLCFHCDQCTKDNDFCIICVASGRGCNHKGQSLNLKKFLDLEDVKKLEVEAQQICEAAANKEEANKENAYRQIVQSKTVVPISLIAYLKFLLYKENKTIYCHQCKLQKPKSKTIHCCGTHRTPRNYCEGCLWNRYGIRLLDCLQEAEWNCPSCKGFCNCAACLRQRGIDPYSYELVIPEVDDITFDNAVEFSVDHATTATRTDFRPRPGRSFNKFGLAKSLGISVQELEKRKKQEAEEAAQQQQTTEPTQEGATIVAEATEVKPEEESQPSDIKITIVASAGTPKKERVKASGTQSPSQSKEGTPSKKRKTRNSSADDDFDIVLTRTNSNGTPSKNMCTLCTKNQEDTRLLRCSVCQNCYHASCLSTKKEDEPEAKDGVWSCDTCTSKPYFVHSAAFTMNWPARVVNTDDVVEETITDIWKNKQSDSILVCFLGEDTVDWVSRSTIEDFNQYKKEYAKKFGRSTKWKAALKEAEAFLADSSSSTQ